MTQPCKFDSITGWIPLEIEHGVNRLNLYPPTACLEGISYQARIVSISNNEFVTVFYVCIFKRYLAHCSLEHIVVSFTHSTSLFCNWHYILLVSREARQLVNDLYIFRIDHHASHRCQMILNCSCLSLLLVLMQIINSLSNSLIVSLLNLLSIGDLIEASQVVLVDL